MKPGATIKILKPAATVRGRLYIKAGELLKKHNIEHNLFLFRLTPGIIFEIKALDCGCFYLIQHDEHCQEAFRRRLSLEQLEGQIAALRHMYPLRNP